MSNLTTILIKNNDEVIGKVVTNHSLSKYEICELAGVDAGHTEDNDYDIDELTFGNE